MPSGGTDLLKRWPCANLIEFNKARCKEEPALGLGQSQARIEAR